MNCPIYIHDYKRNVKQHIKSIEFFNPCHVRKTTCACKYNKPIILNIIYTCIRKKVE